LSLNLKLLFQVSFVSVWVSQTTSVSVSFRNAPEEASDADVDEASEIREESRIASTIPGPGLRLFKVAVWPMDPVQRSAAAALA
jgi:hypothetical protein